MLDTRYVQHAGLRHDFEVLREVFLIQLAAYMKNSSLDVQTSPYGWESLLHWLHGMKVKQTRHDDIKSRTVWLDMLDALPTTVALALRANAPIVFLSSAASRHDGVVP